MREESCWRTALGDERAAEQENGPREALGLDLREPEAVQAVVDVHAGAHEEDAHAADQRHDRRHLRVAVPAHECCSTCSNAQPVQYLLIQNLLQQQAPSTSTSTSTARNLTTTLHL